MGYLGEVMQKVPNVPIHPSFGMTPTLEKNLKKNFKKNVNSRCHTKNGMDSGH